MLDITPRAITTLTIKISNSKSKTYFTIFTVKNWPRIAIHRRWIYVVLFNVYIFETDLGSILKYLSY